MLFIRHRRHERCLAIIPDLMWTPVCKCPLTGSITLGWWISRLRCNDHTFQSGTNEALWLGKPLITSNWLILRRYFNKSTTHIGNAVEDIQQVLLEMQKKLSNFQAEMLALQEERRRQWQEKAETLLLLIQQNINGWVPIWWYLNAIGHLSSSSPKR